MNAGKLVFAQLMAHLPLHTFRQCVASYPSRYPTLTFSHLDQFLCLAFAQLTYRESLRDIEICLRAHQAKLYHMGIRGNEIAKSSTLADAQRVEGLAHLCRICAQCLIDASAQTLRGRQLWHGTREDGLRTWTTTTIDLCLIALSLGVVSYHQIGGKDAYAARLARQHSSFIHISNGKMGDVKALDILIPEAGSNLRHGSGLTWISLGWLHDASGSGILRYSRQVQSHGSAHLLCSVDRSAGMRLRSDHCVHRLRRHARSIRNICVVFEFMRSRYTEKQLVFLTNNSTCLR